MTPNVRLFCLLAPALLSAGCEDLGECEGGPDAARKPVLVGTQVMYAGQAVLWQSCASSQCHAEGATGAARWGAPAGLDFSVQPAPSAGQTTSNAQGQVIVTLDPKEEARLRRNQRKVFEEREAIWEQVVRDFMPPEGIGSFRGRDLGSLISLQGGSCQMGEALGTITSGRAREELRNWLACGAPVIETNASQVVQPAGGTVGDQYPALSCGTLDDSFDGVHATVFASGCVAGCHEPDGSWPLLDLSTPDAAYATLLGPDGTGAEQSCPSNTAPYVTPGDPENSYLMAKLGAAGDYCGTRMPPVPTPLPAEQIELIRSWIENGATREGGSDAGVPGGNAPVSGDAGAADAGP